MRLLLKLPHKKSIIWFQSDLLILEEYDFRLSVPYIWLYSKEYGNQVIDMQNTEHFSTKLSKLEKFSEFSIGWLLLQSGYFWIKNLTIYLKKKCILCDKKILKFSKTLNAEAYSEPCQTSEMQFYFCSKTAK